jgi:hypothetical protein
VIPAILATESALSKVRWLGHVPVPRLRWSPGRDGLCLALGAACIVLPLTWPDVFFPLAWGCLVFLLEPWNRRHARRSILRDLEAGEAAPLLRVLLAGLVCGFLWELWNFWARTKWVYTVPGVGALKLFEMPLLGFLGFPPFAVECQSVVRFLEARRDRASSAPLVRRRALRWATVVVSIAGTAAIFAAADASTVDSIYAPIDRLGVLSAPQRKHLVASGLRSPEALLRAFSTDAGTREWSRRTGIPTGELLAIRDRVALVMHRGLGQDRARELEGLGIRTLGELAGWSPERLAEALRARGARGPDRFLERRARAWLEGLRAQSNGMKPGFSRPSGS